MGNSLMDAFAKAGGKVPEGTQKGVIEADAQQYLDAEAKCLALTRTRREVEKRLGILRKATDPKEFRREAHMLLTLEPGSVQQVLEINHQHRFSTNRNGGTAINGALYALRDALTKASRASLETKQQLVAEIFPKK